MKKIFPASFLCILASTAAPAATLIVDSSDDSLVPTTTGTCTLRGAVKAVNDGADGNNCANSVAEAYGTHDEIQFAPSLAGGTIFVINNSNGNGQIDIRKPLTVTGLLTAGKQPDITLDGGNANRIFYARKTIRITGVKFIHGKVKGSGGAVYADSTVTISHSAFSGNTATNSGGAVRTNATAIIRHSSFSGNSTSTRGVGGGGAVYANTATISSSTFSNNMAADHGGAVRTAESVNISNSSFSGNSAANHGGGAVWANSLDARHLTLLNNVADASGGQAIHVADGALTLHNSIVIGGKAHVQCTMASGSPAGSYNLEGHVDGGKYWSASIAACGGADHVTVAGGTALSAIIASVLADHGGPTPTLALPAGSPAVGKTDPAGGTSQMLDTAGQWVDATLDQRGQPRAANPGERSIGAYGGIRQPAHGNMPIPALPAPALLALMTALGLMGAAARQRAQAVRR